MSKEITTIYKCDRCGKKMDSPYASLTLKHTGISLSNDDYINKDLCADCFDKISFLFRDKDAMTFTTKGSWISIKDCTAPVERTTVTWNGNDGLHRNEVDPLNRHLNVTCV